LTWSVLHAAELAVRGGGPTLAQRLSVKLRHNVLTVGVPVGVVLAFYDAVDLLPARFLDHFDNRWLVSGVTFALVLGGYTVAPLLIVRIWNTRRMPAGPLRERLSDLCRRIGVGYRDIRIWETEGHFFANAAVMGVAGFVRYIIVSRPLTTSMPPAELEAVFAHELGHAKRRHMPYYLAFAADFLLLARLFESVTGASVEAGFDTLILWGFFFLVYWGVGFGIVSRTFERDADLFGAEEAGSYSLFSTALQRIAHLNGVSPSARSWRHGSIRSRVSFLYEAGRDPAVRQAFLDRLEFLKALIVAVAAIGVAATFLVELVI